MFPYLFITTKPAMPAIFILGTGAFAQQIAPGQAAQLFRNLGESFTDLTLPGGILGVPRAQSANGEPTCHGR